MIFYFTFCKSYLFFRALSLVINYRKNILFYIQRKQISFVFLTFFKLDLYKSVVHSDNWDHVFPCPNGKVTRPRRSDGPSFLPWYIYSTKMMIFKLFIFPNIYHDMHANDRFCLEVNISTCYPEFQQPFGTHQQCHPLF